MHKMVTTEWLARRMDLFEDQIVNWIKNAGLPARNDDGQVMVNWADFLVWMNDHRRDYGAAMNEAIARRKLNVVEELDPNKDELLSIKQVAAYLESSESHVKKLLKEWKQIPYVKEGRRYFVKKSELEAFLERNRRRSSGQ